MSQSAEPPDSPVRPMPQESAAPQAANAAILPTSPFAAIDAVVLEDAADASPGFYPYGAPGDSISTPNRAPWGASYPLPYPSKYPSLSPLPREKVYSVPKRFGLSSLLAMITALACLFGALKRVETPPAVYLFLGMQVMTICVAQMFYNAEPRRASMIAGAILMPIFLAGASFFLPGNDFRGALCMLIPSILFGAFAGYLIGTCVAGIFLLMDKLEPFLPGGKKESA